MARKIFYPFVLWMVLSAYTQAQCTVTSLSGNQVISANTSWSAGTYNIAGDFTVNAGVTLTITANNGCAFTVNANNINIVGSIIANGAGNAGGSGGAGGAGAGAGGGAEADGGTGGSIGGGLGAGLPGGNGGNATNGCAISCGNIVCSGGNDADRAGAGGGGGGTGGSYGRTGGNGGAGAAGRLDNEPGNSDCGSTPTPGTGGIGIPAAAAYGNALDNTDLNPGSGGGGGGGGGGGFTTGTTGSAGGNGGGAVNLDASGTLTVTGTISANGTNGGVGGNGGVRSGSSGDWNCTACSNNDGGGANACRDASLCNECTYYTWDWPGGAGGGAGGGSGGGIKLQALGQATVTGTLTANGGRGGNAGRPWSSLDGNCNNYASGGGPGAGGVIKVVFNTCLNNTYTPANVSANAGNPGNGSNGNTSSNTGSSGVIFGSFANITPPGFAVLTTPLIAPAQSICAGVTPATLNAVITGGSGPFTYQWYSSTGTSSGQVGSNIAPAPGWNIIINATTDSLSSAVLGPATVTTYYQVFVQMGNCAQWSTVTAITVTPSPSVDSVSVSNVLCSGSGNGSITVSASGGTGPYNYSIDSGVTYQTSSAFNNLNGGSYNVFVTDANGCAGVYASNAVAVSEPLPVQQTDSTVSATCTYVSNGAIVVTATGGNGIYQYTANGSPYQPSNSFSGIAAGVYYVNVADSNGCTSGAQLVSVGNIDTLVGSVVSQTNVSCNGNTNGSVTVQVTGGTLPYGYSLDSGTVQPSPTFSGLGTASYNITLSDANGCATVINAQITQPAVLQVVVDTIVSVSCGIANSGQIATHAVGGTSPYTFLWSNTDATASISGLGLGAYSVVVTDSNGCVDSSSATVGFDSSLIINITTTSPRCFGDDGGASIAVNNGTAPYIYNWSNGDTTSTVTNLALGSTTVLVSDLNNCTATQTLITSQPSQLIVAIDSVQPTCNSADGSASAGTNGGSTPYIYTWSNNATTDTVNNLAPGAYSVTVYDGHNCTAEAVFSISNISGLALSSTITADSCNGSGNGAAGVVPIGGASPYTYVWNTGDTSAGIAHLAAGNYRVTITDNTGCSVTSTIAVTQPAAIQAVTSTTIASVGQSDGTATIDSISGGTGSYTEQWSNSQTGLTATSLAAGSYTVTITDANGCSQVETVIVTQASGISSVSGGIQLVVYPNPAKNEISVDLGAFNGATTLSVRNVLGQQVIFKPLTSSHNPIDISGLGSGVYTLEVRQGDNAAVREVIVNK